MCRGGWYTFSFRYAQALIKGPSHLLSCHSVTSLCLLAVTPSVPTEHPRVHVLLLCWLCSEASFFSFLAHGTANPSITPPRSACKSAVIGGSIIPGQGFLLGIAPAGWQNACGGPFEFQFPAWLVWSGLACGFFSSALGRGNQGTEGEGDSKGLQSSGTDRQMEGAPPGAITVWAHRLQQTGPAQTDDGQRTDG